MTVQRKITLGRLKRGIAAALITGLAPALTAGAAVNPAPRPGTGALPGTVSTVAGGIGGPGKATQIAMPNVASVAYGAGSLYLSDGPAARKLSPRTDFLRTVAGDGSNGPFTGNSGPATQTALIAAGTTLDHSGNLVIADPGGQRIRVVAAKAGTFYGQAMQAGFVYSVAGNGTTGFSGDGGPASQASLNGPKGVAVDARGNLVFADTGNNRVRVLAARNGRFYGQPMAAGDIYTIAGNGHFGYFGDGGLGTKARISGSMDVAVDAAGNVLIADTGNNRIRVLAGSTGTFYGQPMTVGHIYTMAGNGRRQFNGDGGPATVASLGDPTGVTLDGAGNVLIADTLNFRIRVVAAKTGTFYGQAMTAGDIYTIAGNGDHNFHGNGGLALKRGVPYPSSVAVDGAGNVVIAGRGPFPVLVVAASTGSFYGQPMTAGHLYAVAGNGGTESGFGGPATHAVLTGVLAVAVDGAGNELIGDGSRVLVSAASTGSFYGQPMTAGHLYAIAGNGTLGFSGDGGPASAAELAEPDGVAGDAAGNLVIADTVNGRIRVVPGSTGSFYGQAMTAGHIYTVAGGGTSMGDGVPATSAGLSLPAGVTTDAAGNLLIADSDNMRIRVVAEKTGTFYGQAMTSGDIYTIAGTGQAGFSGDGGPATAAELQEPWGIAPDAAGNVLIADQTNSRIRVVAEKTGTFYGQAMTSGDIYTIAGTGQEGFSGDGGPATAAKISFPFGVAVDAAGNVLIADELNNRVRVVAEKTGNFYGLPVTAGDIYTIAGNGIPGFSGDGGPGISTEVAGPEGVAAGAASSALIADSDNHRVRSVSG